MFLKNDTMGKSNILYFQSTPGFSRKIDFKLFGEFLFKSESFNSIYWFDQKFLVYIFIYVDREVLVYKCVEIEKDMFNCVCGSIDVYA